MLISLVLLWNRRSKDSRISKCEPGLLINIKDQAFFIAPGTIEENSGLYKDTNMDFRGSLSIRNSTSLVLINLKTYLRLYTENGIYIYNGDT